MEVCLIIFEFVEVMWDKMGSFKKSTLLKTLVISLVKKVSENV